MYINMYLFVVSNISLFRHQDGPEDGLGHHRGAGRGWAGGGGAGGRQGPRQQGGGRGLRGVLGSHPGGH